MKNIYFQFIQDARRIAGCCGAVLLAAISCVGQAAAPATTALGTLSQSLRGPVRVAADAAGRTYVTDRSAGQVFIFDAFGRPVAGKSGLAGPLALAVAPSGRIYVGEEQKGSVSVFDGQWNLLFQLGQGDGEFALPSHIAIDPATGTAFVCDSAANQIKLYRDSQLLSAFGGSGSGPGQFDLPAGLWVSPAGEVFVVDQNNNRVQVFNRSGVFQRLFSLDASGAGSTRTGRSQGVAGDTNGRIYVADTYQGYVQVFDTQGNFLATIGSYGNGSARFRSPVSLAADAYGRLLVTSANKGRIDLLGLDGFIHLAASPASQLVAAGTRVTLSVSIAGPGPFTYQWRKGPDLLSDTPTLAGATQPMLTLTAVTTNDTGAYSVVVTGPSGTFTSPDAVLTVLTSPTILAQPASQTVAAGTSTLLAVSALGDSLTYQWCLDGAPLPGASRSALTIPGAQPANAGCYTVVLSNAVGLVTSDAATLTVFSRPASPQLEPLSFLPDGSLRLFFSGEAGYTYAIEASTNLADWTTLTTVFSADGSVEYFDADAAASSPRFYRLRWLP